MTSRNELAETIHKARWPADRQMAITPFAEEDRNGREYCFRIADAVLAANTQEAWVAALLNAPNPDATPVVGGERERIARIIDEHSVDTVKMHGSQNASRQAVRDAAVAFAKADAILAALPASPLRGRNETIEECAQIAAQHYWCGGGAIVCSDVIAAKIRALLSAAPPEQPPAAPEVQFLLDRLEEYDPEDEDHVRDFHGHVAPAIARLRNAVTNTSDGMISVNRETDFQVSPIKSDGETKA